MKIITIGGATQDSIIQYKEQEMLNLQTVQGKQSFLILEEGKKIEVSELDIFTGGGSTNSAVSFKKLGFTVDTFCKVGSDTPADFVLKQLQEKGIGTQHIVRSDTMPTGSSFIIPTLSGDRVVFAFRGSNTQLLEKEIPTEAIKQSDWLYITSLSGNSSKLLLPITEQAKKNNIPVANNPGISQLAAGAHTLRNALKNIEILILNADEASQFMQSLVQTDKELKEKITHKYTNSKNKQDPTLMQAPIHFRDIQFNIRDFFETVLSHGPKIVVVTNGAEGVYVASEETIYFHPSIKPKKIASTLGAGDSFGSCFTACIALGKSIENSLLMGILNSSSVISLVGAKNGLLDLQELEKRAKATPKGLLRTFSMKKKA